MAESKSPDTRRGSTARLSATARLREDEYALPRRHSIVRRDGVVDETAQRTNEQMSQMVALQAAALTQRQVRHRSFPTSVSLHFSLPHEVSAPRGRGGIGTFCVKVCLALFFGLCIRLKRATDTEGRARSESVAR